MPKNLQELLKSNPSEKEISDWIPTAADEDLIDFLPMFVSNRKLYDRARTILTTRRYDELKRPHWTSTWSLLLALAATIFAAIAAWPVIQSWLQRK
jgi:hypothetical protein